MRLVPLNTQFKMSLKFEHRSNMRGIRKCTQCGTFNGNRASKCKNRNCQQKLKETTNSSTKSTPLSVPSAVQLLQSISSNGHLYSVSLGDGMRHIIHSSNGADGTISSLSPDHGSVITYQDTIKQLILGCKSTAEAVPLHKEVIESLCLSEDEKFSLWEKQSHPSGSPLVQRLVNDFFVVGHCQTAYGLQHVAALKKNQKYSNFHCNCCQANGGEDKSVRYICWHMTAVAAGLLSAPEKYAGERWMDLLKQFGDKNISQRSDVLDERKNNSALSYEFFLEQDDGQISISGEHIEMQSMLNSTIMELFNEQDENDPVLDEPSSNFPPTACIPSMCAGGEESLHLMDCQIELMDELDPTDRIDFCPSYIECADSLLAPDEEAEEKQLPEEKVVQITAKRASLKRCGRMDRDKLTRGSYNVRKLMKVLESNGIIFNRLRREFGKRDDGTSIPPYEAIECSLSFTRWLGSVIEQLNSVIDYNRDGRPDVQTFRIHEDFFRCLRARFSVGHHLRQPEPVEGRDQEGKNQPQVYKFTHHKSLLHVFRTDEIKLCFEKTFNRTASDRYTASDDVTDEDETHGPGSAQDITIRPLRYSTYIKLGRYKHEPDPERVYHFTIEWIGGVLPRSGHGDLRISFEYGHRMNNQYMPPPTPVCTME